MRFRRYTIFHKAGKTFELSSSGENSGRKMP